jgi:hypothetical protein
VNALAAAKNKLASLTAGQIRSELIFVIIVFIG